MIEDPAFDTDGWCLRTTTTDVDLLPHTESLFALSNGHLGWRGNLDEGEPHGLPGSYLNGVYEQRPLPSAEAAYGLPDAGETMINITNGKVIRLLVDDEPFDIRYGSLLTHERELNWRDGALYRTARWQSPAGRVIEVRSTRLVSLTQRAIAAIHYEVEAVDAPVRIVVQSELIANEALPLPTDDPRAAGAPGASLTPDMHDHSGTRASLVHTTRCSGLRVAAAMDHEVTAPAPVDTEIESAPDVGRFTVTTVLHPGEKLEVTKYVAYHWSAVRSLPAMRDQAEAALSAVRHTGFSELLAQQHAALDDFWSRADVVIEGDPKIQQAVRFCLFHLYQAGARAEQRAIGAKGLTGNGYDGHTFWDGETFVLQVLTYTDPKAAANALRWRYNTLPAARARARLLGLDGAAFPWRTISGAECSGYWPASTAAFHINADIADAVVRYRSATHDDSFDSEVGTSLLVETARLWCSLGHFDSAGRFRIEGVTGPDEYSALGDNNVYTNLMAQHNLREAVRALQRNPACTDRCRVRDSEIRRWRAAADSMYIPYDPALGIHPQADNFLDHARWPFSRTPPDHYPLLLHYPYFDLYRKQVVKQADLVLAMHLRGDAFTDAEKVRNVDYYEQITVRDSSLSACSQAVLAAEVGHSSLAYSYLCEAALMDLDDLAHNTVDGLHLASLAGSWIAIVAGFGGMRHCRSMLQFAPRLPTGWNRLSFRLLLDGAILQVDIEPDQAHYSLSTDEPAPITIRHYDRDISLSAGATISLPILPPVPRPTPRQPPGREPTRRGVDFGVNDDSENT